MRNTECFVVTTKNISNKEICKFISQIYMSTSKDAGIKKKRSIDKEKKIARGYH